ADEIALHQVRRGIVADGDSLAVVAGDEVAGPVYGVAVHSADCLGRRQIVEADAALAVPQRGSAGGVGADPIALHEVAAAADGKIDAPAVVARDDVAGDGRSAANH